MIIIKYQQKLPLKLLNISQISSTVLRTLYIYYLILRITKKQLLLLTSSYKSGNRSVVLN